MNNFYNKLLGSDALEKNREAAHVVLPYLEKELQPRGVPAWVTALFIAFVLSALLFPFYA